MVGFRGTAQILSSRTYNSEALLQSYFYHPSIMLAFGTISCISLLMLSKHIVSITFRGIQRHHRRSIASRAIGSSLEPRYSSIITRLYSTPTLLTADERDNDLKRLLISGWEKVDSRDAIRKEFVFKNFIEVCVLKTLNI